LIGTLSTRRIVQLEGVDMANHEQRRDNDPLAPAGIHEKAAHTEKFLKGWQGDPLVQPKLETGNLS